MLEDAPGGVHGRVAELSGPDLLPGQGPAGGGVDERQRGQCEREWMVEHVRCLLSADGSQSICMRLLIASECTPSQEIIMSASA